jgi:hypothetical protein
MFQTVGVAVLLVVRGSSKETDRLTPFGLKAWCFGGEWIVDEVLVGLALLLLGGAIAAPILAPQLATDSEVRAVNFRMASLLTGACVCFALAWIVST